MPDGTQNMVEQTAQAPQNQTTLGQEIETTMETTPNENQTTTRRPRHPRVLNRTAEQLISVSPRSMTEAEKIRVIDQLRADNAKLQFKVTETQKIAGGAFDKAKYMEKRATELLQHETAQNAFVLRAVRACYESVAMAVTPRPIIQNNTPDSTKTAGGTDNAN